MTIDILITHNRYRSSSPSGENSIVDRETDLLRTAGASMQLWEKNSDNLVAQGFVARIKAARNLINPQGMSAVLENELRARRPKVIHAHNVLPMFSYELFRVAARLGLPTLQTVHNFRLISSNSHFISESGIRRPESPREREHLKRLAPMHGRMANWFYTRSIAQAWRDKIPQNITGYLCGTEFQRQLLLSSGIPAERLILKPNFLKNPGPAGTGSGEYVVYVGRLAIEKGILELVMNWPRTGLPLRIIGDGPIRDKVAALATGNIQLMGKLERNQTQAMVRDARFLVMNSTWYEGFPLVLVESMAAGTPCLVPDLGSMSEIIANGRLGRLFKPDDPADMVNCAGRLWDEAGTMREACRAEYELKYTPERNLRLLQTIYDNVINGRLPGYELSSI